MSRILNINVGDGTHMKPLQLRPNYGFLRYTTYNARSTLNFFVYLQRAATIRLSLFMFLVVYLSYAELV